MAITLSLLTRRPYDWEQTLPGKQESYHLLVVRVLSHQIGVRRNRPHLLITSQQDRHFIVTRNPVFHGQELQLQRFHEENKIVSAKGLELLGGREPRVFVEIWRVIHLGHEFLLPHIAQETAPRPARKTRNAIVDVCEEHGSIPFPSDARLHQNRRNLRLHFSQLTHSVGHRLVVRVCHRIL